VAFFEVFAKTADLSFGDFVKPSNGRFRKMRQVRMWIARFDVFVPVCHLVAVTFAVLTVAVNCRAYAAAGSLPCLQELTGFAKE
jgi:hypothetical protein